MSSSRRSFLGAFAFAPLAATRLASQDSTANTMSGDGYLPVRLPPKGGDRSALTALERDATERRISCPCPCTLDVFTCRTSMPCGFSPRMHADVIALAEGGYSGDEILDAFVRVYGEIARMAPPKSGFNLVGWFAPSVAIAVGAVAITMWLRRAREAGPVLASSDPMLDASAEESARIDAAVRDDR